MADDSTTDGESSNTTIRESAASEMSEDDIQKLDAEEARMRKKVEEVKLQRRTAEVKQRIQAYKSELRSLEDVSPANTKARAKNDGDNDNDIDDDEVHLKTPKKTPSKQARKHQREWAESARDERRSRHSESDRRMASRSVKVSENSQVKSKEKTVYHHIIARKHVAVKPIRLIKSNSKYIVINQDDCKNPSGPYKIHDKDTSVDNCYDYVVQQDGDRDESPRRSHHSNSHRETSHHQDHRDRRNSRDRRDQHRRAEEHQADRDREEAGRPFILYSSSHDSLTSHKSAESRKRGKGILQSGILARASDTVKYPQDWPHIALQGDRVTGSYTFHELDVKLFVTGELELISRIYISSGEQEGRLRLLRQLMYLSRVYEWPNILKLYAEVVTMIEEGSLSWLSSFEDTINWAINRDGVQGIVKGPKKPNTSNTQKKPQYRSARPTYCKDYQQNTCAFQDSKHWGFVNGERMQVEHICAACLIKRKEINQHGESSADCPCKAGTGPNTQ